MVVFPTRLSLQVRQPLLDLCLFFILLFSYPSYPSYPSSSSSSSSSSAGP